MKRILKTAIFTLAFSAALCLGASAMSLGGGTVTATALNLRTEPDVSSGSLGLLGQGAIVLVEERLDGWYRVCSSAGEGYVSADYLAFSETLEGGLSLSASLTGTDVRMRSGPNTDSAVLGYFGTGDSVEVTGVSAEWLRVTSAAGVQGYIRSDFLSFSDEKAVAAPAAMGEQLVETAKQYLGTPYVWGGMSERGFDCSGFVNYVYDAYGVDLERVAQSIYSKNGTYVEKSDLRAGDLVFFGYSGTSVTHVGMYIGGGQFIHASSGSGKVVITDLSSSYYTRMYVGAKRIAE